MTTGGGDGRGTTHEQLDDIARLARECSLQVAVAESLTSGAVASFLGQGEGAGTWFRGGLVAYSMTAKTLLGVPEGPVMTAECAAQMALGACRLLDADVAVAVTGVGGPDEEEGKPPGTVYVAAAGRTELRLAALHLEGDPSQVVERTVEHAVHLLHECVMDLVGDRRDDAAVSTVDLVR